MTLSSRRGVVRCAAPACRRGSGHRTRAGPSGGATLWFAGTATGGTLRAGDDANDGRFFPLHEIDVPLAFETDTLILEQLRTATGA